MTALIILMHVGIHHYTTPVGSTESVAREWMHGEFETFLASMMIRETYILRCEQSLRSNIVRIHALPTTWDCTTMEYNLQTVTVGIREDIFVELHHLLLIRAKEVDLDTCDIILLHPCHFLFASNRSVHTSARTLWSIIPIAIRVIPKHKLHTLRLCIARELFNLLSAYLLIPQSVYEAIFIAHSGSKVDELNLIVVVYRIILPHQP